MHTYINACMHTRQTDTQTYTHPDIQQGRLVASAIFGEDRQVEPDAARHVTHSSLRHACHVISTPPRRAAAREPDVIARVDRLRAPQANTAVLDR